MASFLTSYERRLLTPVTKRTLDLADPQVNAPAWAASRHDLSETLSYFRSFSGGIYQIDGLIHGILLDAHGGSRSHLDAETIITRLYGESNKATNRTTATTRRKAALRNHDEGSPIVVILGRKNPQAEIAFRQPARYAVMGLYWITDVWFERFGPADFGMIRLEKVNLASKSWFAPARENPPPIFSRDFTTRPVEHTCNTCQRSSPRRYREAWICSNPDCADFTTNAGNAVAEDLHFDETFLIQRHQYQGNVNVDIAPRRLTSAFPIRDLWRGSVCPHCRRCSRRIHWNRWVCEGCGSTYQAPPRIPTKQQLSDAPPKPGRPKGHILNSDDFRIQDNLLIRNKSYNVHQYILPGDSGSIYLLDPVDNMTAQNDFVDDAWGQVTQLANMDTIPLKRCAVASGELRTRSFLHNYGEHYNFSAKVATEPFNTSPAVIRTMLDVVIEAENAVISAPELAAGPPNELLLAGYWEEQEMNWHTDGEAEIGSPITTLSLGGNARMEWAYNHEWYNHKHQRQDKNWEPLPGDPLPDSRYYQAVTDLRTNNPNLSAAQYNARRRDIIMNDPPPSDTTSPPAFLIANLRHGSIVFMVSQDMATKVRHAVRPLGEMRFAATFRRVDNEQLKTGITSKGKVNKKAKRKASPSGDRSTPSKKRGMKEESTEEESGDDTQAGPSNIAAASTTRYDTGLRRSTRRQAANTTPSDAMIWSPPPSSSTFPRRTSPRQTRATDIGSSSALTGRNHTPWRISPPRPRTKNISNRIRGWQSPPRPRTKNITIPPRGRQSPPRTRATSALDAMDLDSPPPRSSLSPPFIPPTSLPRTRRARMQRAQAQAQAQQAQPPPNPFAEEQEAGKKAAASNRRRRGNADEPHASMSSKREASDSPPPRRRKWVG